MPSADQVPIRSTHSTMRWHKWVVLIAGSTGSALRAVRLIAAQAVCTVTGGSSSPRWCPGRAGRRPPPAPPSRRGSSGGPAASSAARPPPRRPSAPARAARRRRRRGRCRRPGAAPPRPRRAPGPRDEGAQVRIPLGVVEDDPPTAGRAPGASPPPPPEGDRLTAQPPEDRLLVRADPARSGLRRSRRPRGSSRPVRSGRCPTSSGSRTSYPMSNPAPPIFVTHISTAIGACRKVSGAMYSISCRATRTPSSSSERVLAEPLLEPGHARVLQESEELDVVDVAVGVHVGPSQGHVDAVRAARHGAQSGSPTSPARGR